MHKVIMFITIISLVLISKDATLQCIDINDVLKVNSGDQL
jgi:hypothetical protein